MKQQIYDFRFMDQPTLMISHDPDETENTKFYAILYAGTHWNHVCFSEKEALKLACSLINAINQKP